ncbi:hypothetical protein [Streptomyces beijiangensis]|uniref:Integral membrane protein n=1 Tax=Streptomyces beijiangensis TaxID=163361 RepID=A0A939F3U8_9ACTN|nr:hypothetical protein [Streptomyces beijiangensis]MBO0511239.1 hypothetical protein [Streptomyces beijiangensis]
MSSEQTSPTLAPRPARLAYAAALCALEGAALVVAGVYLLIRGAVGSDGTETGATAGVTLIVLALIPLIAARGLLRQKAWSRGPAIITQIIALPVAWTLLKSENGLIPAGIVLAVVAVTGLVLLINPATAKALGIRGPRDA